MPERDPMTFESRLADAFDRYVAAAPVDVDALSLAAVVATGSRRAGPMFGRPRPRTVRLALVLGLLAVAAFGAALMAGALLRAQPGPLGGGGRLMVFSNGTAHVLDVDGTVVVSRSVATRSGGCPS